MCIGRCASNGFRWKRALLSPRAIFPSTRYSKPLNTFHAHDKRTVHRIVDRRNPFLEVKTILNNMFLIGQYYVLKISYQKSKLNRTTKRIIVFPNRVCIRSKLMITCHRYNSLLFFSLIVKYYAYNIFMNNTYYILT